MKPRVNLIAVAAMCCSLLLSAVGFSTPNASFTANRTSGCSPLNVQFTNTSTGAVSYYWDLGNGNSSTLTNPSNVFTSAGSYTIILVATDGNGAKDTARYVSYITVMPEPTAGFFCANRASCLDNNSFTFSNTSTGASSYLWDFGDGNISNVQNPVHSYTLPGTFTVTLIATNSNGCSDQRIINQYITIYPKPQATIVANALNGCDPSAVFNFSCPSSGVLTYQWDFGDGATSNQPAPSHTYAAGGVYNVSLILTNSYGCSDTSASPVQITVGSATWADFINSTPSGCIPWSVNFVSMAANITSCTWYFGDGGSSTLLNPTHTYNNAGSYTVTYIVHTTNGCTDTIVKNNLVVTGTLPVVNFSYHTVNGCAPATVQFTNLSSNYDSCEWSFGDGSTSTAVNPTHIYTNNGNYSVTLRGIGHGGCSQTMTMQNIISVSSVKALFSATPRVGCPPLATTFTDFSMGNQLTYFWDFGDGSTSTQQSPTHTYNASGSFDVTLIVRNAAGCSDTLFKQAYVQTVNPAGNYTPPPPTSGCAPLTAQFTDGTLGSTAWLWNFGDGVTSTQQAPLHTYTIPGTYTVSLTTTSSGGGCQQTITNFSTFIASGGYAGFTHTESHCPPYVSTFTDTSLNAVSWLWSFDDGTTSTQQNPAHIFAVPGFHSASLTITTADGCTYNVMQSNGIYFMPFGANFYGIPQGTSFPTTVDFHANSLGATGWLWDFGDGTTSNLENPSHYYSSAGNYTVTLTITNGVCTVTYAQPSISFGMPDTSSIPIGNPGVIEPQQGCVPFSINFSQTFRGAVQWHWDFGDGDSSSLEFPSHTYVSPGIYTVILTTYDTLNLPSVLQMDSVVRVSGPSAHFSFTQLPNCQNTQIALHDSSSNAWFWYWQFGDSTTDTIQNPVHLYSNHRPNYIISLLVTDTAGCTSSLSTSIFSDFISPVIASENEICGLDTVHFTTSLQNYSAYLWDFGDGNTSASFNPSHLYLTEGHYTVSLTVTDLGGCSQTFTLNPAITVNMPNAVFQINGPAQGCSELTVNFTNLSTNADGYLWDFGDGNTSTILSPSHYYGFAGIYNVTLTVFRGNCVSTFMIPNAVEVDTVKAAFHCTINGPCSPVIATYTDASVNAVSWSWFFGDSATSTLQNPVHAFNHLVGYGYLAIEDIHGCRDTAIIQPIGPMVVGFNTSADSGCLPLTVHFTNWTPGGINYWDFGDGDTSSADSPTHIYSAPGNYTVKLVVQVLTYNHCKDSIIKPMLIHVKQPVAGFTATNLHGCAPYLVNFTDLSHDADHYLWDFGDSTTSTDPNPSHIYTRPGIYSVKLVVSAYGGCADSFLIPNYVTVLGPVTMFTATAVVGCQPLNVSFIDQSINAIDWSWNFGDGNSVQSRNSSHTYPDTGTFTVTLVTHDTAGCFSYYEYPQKVIVHPQSHTVFSTTDTIGCSPVTAHFTNTSNGMDQLLWDFGDNNFSTDTSGTVTHVYTTPGFYRVTLMATNSFGCNDTGYSVPINVLASPQVSFTNSALQGCQPLYINFTSHVIGLQNASYLWDFGNGVTSVDPNPTIMFSTQGWYNISLTVTNNNGCSQTITVPSYILPMDSLPPPVTNILSVSVLSNTSVEIQWENNPAIDLGGYILYRLNTHSHLYDNIYNDTNVSNTNFSLNPSYIDTGLNTLSNVYTYKLLTYDICRNVIPLSQLNAHSTIDISSTVDSNGIEVTWNAYGGCPVSGYNIYRHLPQSDTTWRFVATVPHDSLHYLDTIDLCPHQYSYRVVATDLCGNTYTSFSDTTIALPPNIFVNQIVDAVRSTVEDNQYVLTEWKQPVVHPEKVVQFDIYRSTDTVNYSYVTSVPSQQTDYIDHNVDVQSNKYYYKILVINTCDVTEDLSTTTSTILLKGEMNEARTVHLLWTPYTRWASGVDFYVIEMKDDSGNWQFIKQVDGTETHCDDQQ